MTISWDRSKAVAEGALLFYLDNMVRARVARHAYGTRYRIYYDARQPDHNKRKKTIVRDLEGKFVVPKAFAMIIPKVRNTLQGIYRMLMTSHRGR